MKTKKDAATRRSSEEVNALKERILAVRKRLPPGAVTLFVSRYPDFNGYKKSSRVRNVHSMLIVDEDITAKFEDLAAEYEAEAKKGNVKPRK